MGKNSKSDTIILKNILTEKKLGSMNDFIKEKTNYVREIIRNTIISILHNRHYDIFSNNDIALSLNILNELYEKTQIIENSAESEKKNRASSKSNRQAFYDYLRIRNKKHRRSAIYNVRFGIR
jgi:hypothetical protein